MTGLFERVGRRANPAVELLPPRVRQAIASPAGRRRRRPALWGNLRRLGGFSPPYAEGRGTAVDRYYVERFLADRRARITGRVLEVNDPAYTRRFGVDVVVADAVDIRADNPDATIIADLCRPRSLPADTFDCAIVTQTLHLLSDMPVAIDNLRNSLRPGGSLLLTGPVTSPSAPDLPSDAWRFTPLGLRLLAERCAADGDEIEVVGYGNRVSSVAFLLGLSLEDLRRRDLDPYHPYCPLLVGLRLTRSAAG